MLHWSFYNRLYPAEIALADTFTSMPSCGSSEFTRTSDPSSSPPSKARCASFLRGNLVVPSYSWSRLRIYQAVRAHTTPLPHHLPHNPATAKRLGFASTVHFIAASHPHYGTDSKVTSREALLKRTTAGPPQSGGSKSCRLTFFGYA